MSHELLCNGHYFHKQIDQSTVCRRQTCDSVFASTLSQMHASGFTQSCKTKQNPHSPLQHRWLGSPGLVIGAFVACPVASVRGHASTRIPSDQFQCLSILAFQRPSWSPQLSKWGCTKYHNRDFFVQSLLENVLLTDYIWRCVLYDRSWCI